MLLSGWLDEHVLVKISIPHSYTWEEKFWGLRLWNVCVYAVMYLGSETEIYLSFPCLMPWDDVDFVRCLSAPARHWPIALGQVWSFPRVSPYLNSGCFGRWHLEFSDLEQSTCISMSDFAIPLDINLKARLEAHGVALYFCCIVLFP